MVTDDRKFSRTLRWAIRVGGLLVVAGGTLLLTDGPDSSATSSLKATVPPAKAEHTHVTGRPGVELFRHWPKRPPDAALVLTGQLHGYYHPCGCSRPQLGGLERRYNFVQSLMKRGWPVLPIDLGDVFEDRKRRKPQHLLKYRKSMEAMHRIGYSAVGLGLHEMEIPLLTALGEYALNNTSPRILAANLKDKDTNFAGLVDAWTVTQAGTGGLRVGIVGIVGPTVARKVPANQRPAVQFGSTAKVLPKAFEYFDEKKADVRVLLYHGTVDEAKACAKFFPQLHVVLCLSKEEEPSNRPTRVGTTLVIGVGHKGRYVGVVGAFKTGKPDRPYDLRYQLVAMGEEYATPEAQEKDNPILKIFEEYAQEVAGDDYLSRYPRTKHPVQLAFPDAEYVGSQSCLGCHQKAYQVWMNSAHAHAYQTLVDATKPSLRHLDGECIVCHTVGFEYKTGFQNMKLTEHLINVGCENCHGPGSAHMDDTKNKRIHDLMNPHRYSEDETAEARKRRLNFIDQGCQKCHDTDNDVHWDFAKKYPKIVHPERERKKPY